MVVFAADAELPPVRCAEALDVVADLVAQALEDEDRLLLLTAAKYQHAANIARIAATAAARQASLRIRPRRRILRSTP